MKKMILIAGVLMVSLAMAFALVGCGKSEEKADEPAEEEQQEEQKEEAPEVDGTKYGYSGSNGAELAVFVHLADEISKDYPKADASIPAANFVKTDEEDPEDVKVYGAFWVYNYDVDGDTLKMKSGGAHPGCMHFTKKDDGTYEFKSFDAVEDGSEAEPSAKKIFGDDYDAFSKAESDDKANEDLRKEAVTTYVKANGLEVTQYQDEGWPAVKLDL